MTENQEDGVKNGANRYSQLHSCICFQLAKGLSPFVEYCSNEDHRKILENVKRESKFPCTSCDLKTLKPDHNSIQEDGSKKNKCGLGQKNCNCFKGQKSPCPVCGVIYSEIIRLHKHSSPNWTDTNISKWCTDPIEIMKCFLPVTGHGEQKCVSDVDIAGLLHYVLNNKTALSLLKINVNGSNLYEETRRIRNMISHPLKYDVSNSDVTEGIEYCISILNDVSRVRTFDQTTEALKGLQESKLTGNIVLTTGEQLALQEPEPETHFPALREDLIPFIREECSSMQISPTRPEVDTSLCNIYVTPNVCQVMLETFTEKQSAKRKEVQYYADIFSNCTNIYLIGESGIGKTAFIKRLALTWCEAHSPEKYNRNIFSKEDLCEMKTFDALFMVNLDENCSDISDIDEMITQQVIEHLSRRSRYKSGKLLEDILHRGKCLIILDSLEKWSGKKCQIPQRKARENCVIITATSSWESIKELGLRKCEQLIEIQEMDDDTVNKLISNVLQIRFPEISGNPDELQKKCAEIKEKYLLEYEGPLYVPIKVMDVFCRLADNNKHTRQNGHHSLGIK